MNATLTFNLPDDKYDYDVCNQAYNCNRALNQIKNEIRSKLKHGNLSDEEYAFWESLNSFFYDTLNENEVNIELLY
jgi:uncharacterized protein (DUF2252 family)